MEPETKTLLASICGGVLGWAIGPLIDAFLPRLNITKSKPLLVAVFVAMLAATLALRFG